MKILAPLLLCLLVAACELKFGDDYTLDASSFDAAALQTVERCSRLALPAGTRGLNMFYQGSGIDGAMLAKLEVPAEAAPALAEQIRTMEGADGGATESLAKGHAWWDPDALKVTVHRELNVGSDFLEVVFGQEDGKWILFVKWFST